MCFLRYGRHCDVLVAAAAGKKTGTTDGLIPGGEEIRFAAVPAFGPSGQQHFVSVEPIAKDGPARLLNRREHVGETVDQRIEAAAHVRGDEAERARRRIDFVQPD